MPTPEEIELEKQKEPKKSLIQKWWKRVLATLAVLTVLTGIFEGIYICTEFWHEYKILKENVVSEDYEERISSLEDYVLEKKKSFHVGFRVFNVYDDETELTYKVKRYRDWNGVWHRIFKDVDASELYGVDYFYYINEISGEKIYCW